MKTRLFVVALTTLSYLGVAQTRPAIFKDTPRQLVPTTVIASFPKKTFLENLVITPNDDLLVTNLEAGLVEKINPDGTKTEYARTKGRLAGIAAYGQNEFLLTGWDEANQPTVFLLDKNHAISKVMAIKGAMFLNGITPLTATQFLIADAFKGCIWLLDMTSKTTSVWLRDPLLGLSDPKQQTPAVNGLKIHQGVLYASNTQRQLLLRIPIRQGKAGTPRVFVDKVNLDDFAIDKQGTLYGCTHFYNSVIRITPAGKITVIAEQPQGAAGCTSLAFGRSATDKHTLYVITNGGMLLPPPTGIESAKVLKVALP